MIVMINICVILNEGQCQYNEHVISLPGAVTVPSLMLMTSVVSEESLARDTQTDRHKFQHKLTYVFLSVARLRKSLSKIHVIGRFEIPQQKIVINHPC